jgi:hypothetical protein
MCENFIKNLIVKKVIQEWYLFLSFTLNINVCNQKKTMVILKRNHKIPRNWRQIQMKNGIIGISMVENCTQENYPPP